MDDCEVEKDAKVRRRIKSIYNKTEDDFPTLLEYQNYEEMIEDIIFMLVHGTTQEKETTESHVREYEKANVREITKKQSKAYELEQQVLEKIRIDELKLKERVLEDQVSASINTLDLIILDTIH